MVKIEIDYQGELRCRAQHSPSGTEVVTDAPLDNQGLGQSFSPTDLVATALGTCIATIMGIAARSREIDLAGLAIKVGKVMSDDLPRRIVRLEVEISIPLAADHPKREVFEKAALTCPVHQSIHPDIEVPIDWTWAG